MVLYPNIFYFKFPEMAQTNIANIYNDSAEISVDVSQFITDKATGKITLMVRVVVCCSFH